MTFENVSFIVSTFLLRLIKPSALDGTAAAEQPRTSSGVNVSYVNKVGDATFGEPSLTSSDGLRSVDRYPPPSAILMLVSSRDLTAADLPYFVARMRTTRRIRKYSTGLSLALPGDVK